MSEDNPKTDNPDSPNPKRPVGRPPLEFPKPIDDTPENVAKLMFGVKPKKKEEWRYWQDHLANQK